MGPEVHVDRVLVCGPVGEEDEVDTNTNEILGTFHGDENFFIDWKEGEADLFWILDDLHCPNPISPMFFDVGGWWLTCDHIWQVWMPLARPAIAAVGIFTFVLSWNNFIWPFVIVTNTDMMTIPVGLATMQSSYGLRYADIMASAVLGGLPLLIVFLFFQRQIVQGIASTGLKG